MTDPTKLSENTENSEGAKAIRNVSETTSRAGTWNFKTYNNVTNVLQSKELPVGVIDVVAIYYGIASAVGVAMGIAIDAANATAGQSAIDAGDTLQHVIDKEPVSLDFSASDAVTRVDFKTMVAETGTSKFVLGWKV